MNAYRRVKLKIFIINTIFDIVATATILFVASLFGKVVEALLFYISWNILQKAFPKICHVRSEKPIRAILGCMMCSVFSYYIAFTTMLPVGMSIFSGTIICIWMNYVFYIFAEYRDMKNDTQKRLTDLYKMSESELRKYASSQGVSELVVDTLILKVIHNYKWVEIEKERGYSKGGIRYHKEALENILKVKFK